ncbi:hypothetical protein ATCC90586_006647 [Pythium insidiosum]|nr:hypothetical protein ATCC90586_006647 [Pythium insidiosum]
MIMSNVVAIPHLSFATDLLFNLEDVRTNCTRGLATQQSVVTMLKGRIALERHYANELNKLAQQSRLDEQEHGTMKEALGKLKAQYLNTSVQHRSLANNLEEDVLRPIEALFTYNTHKVQNLNKLVSNIKKQAKVHEDAYRKDYQAFEKLFREATVQFAVAMDAGFSSTVIEEQYSRQLAEMDEIQYANDHMHYIKGVLCGYLTIQNGTKDDAKRRRFFVVLSDTRMDYYANDPRPEFEEPIADSYEFAAATRAHAYIEVNPRAPQNSFCLITDKMTDVFIAESAADAARWLAHVEERLAALSQILTGVLWMRKELRVTQQLQRALWQTKYTWSERQVELGRSTLRYRRVRSAMLRRAKIMKQFLLTGESHVSEEPLEMIRNAAFSDVATTAGIITSVELKQIQSDPRPQHTLRNARVIFPFVVCTGPAHLYAAAPSAKVRSEWISALRMRIISLKHHQLRSVSAANERQDEISIHLHNFMQVQKQPGAPWKRRYVELDNGMLKIKLSERTLGSKFDALLLPTTHAALNPQKANAITIETMGHVITLAAETLQQSQQWLRAIHATVDAITPARCEKFFDDELRELLEHSVVYTLDVAANASPGLVVEKFGKRAFVLSHAMRLIPPGSVLVDITQLGMVHDSFETIWHKIRQKKSFPHPMRLSFRVPLRRRGVLAIKCRLKDRWTTQQCLLANGTLSVLALPSATQPQSKPELMFELPMRWVQVELMKNRDANARNVLKITTKPESATGLPPAVSTLYVRVPVDHELFVWYVMLRLESGVAQDDPRYPVTTTTMKNFRSIPALGASQLSTDEQLRQCGECKIAGRRLADIESALTPIEAKLREPQLDDNTLVLPPVKNDDGAVAILRDDEMQAFFRELDVIGCGRVSSTALCTTLEALTRHLPSSEAQLANARGVVRSLVPGKRDFASFTLEQTMTVLRAIDDVAIARVLRKFLRHDVQCM